MPGDQLQKQRQQQQQIQVNAGEQNLQVGNVTMNMVQTEQEQQQENINMPVTLNSVNAVADDDEEFEEPIQEQKESVAMNGTHQEIDKRLFGGDGFHMRKLKKELNEGESMRAEESGNMNITLPQDYTVEMIQDEINEGTLQDVRKKMENIVSICKRYRFFHPFPLSQKGKQRKADVVAVEKSAKEKLKACKERIKELKSRKVNMKSVGGAYDQATRGANQVGNIVKTGLSFTLWNLWNTAVMIPSAVVWAGASAVKSMVKGKPSSAFPIPHPHGMQFWYNFYSSRTERDIKQKNAEDKGPNRIITIKDSHTEKVGDKKVQRYTHDVAESDYIYNQPVYGKVKWHFFLLAR